MEEELEVEEQMNARVGMEIEEFWTLFRLLLACFA